MKVFKKQNESIIDFSTCYVNQEPLGNDIDVTNYDTLYMFYKANQIDYSTFRKALKMFNFNELHTSEQTKLVNEFVAPSFEIMQQFKSNEELELIYANMVFNEKKSRIKRFESITYIAGFELKANEMYQFMAYNDIKLFKEDYIDVDFPALLAFITSSSIPELEIDFTNTGFSSKVYYSETLKTKVLTILTK